MGKKKDVPKALPDKPKQTQQPKAGKKSGKNKGGTTSSGGAASTLTKKPSTPTLRTVPETGLLDSAATSPAEEGQTVSQEVEAEKPCPMSYFGVKSYLHQFYEVSTPQSAESYEEDYHYLIRPKGSQSIGAYLFKVGLIIGSTLFLMGAVAIIIGYAIPKHVEIKQQTDEFKLVDRNAIRFNRNLDICKLIGLAGFCSGGLILVISLLAPTFSSSYWDVEGLENEPFRVPIGTPTPQDDEPKSPIPVTEKIKCIQPSWSED